MKDTSIINIKKYTDGKIEDKEDLVASERNINIFLNGDHYINLMCTPCYIHELAIGFLFSEGIIKSFDDIKSIKSSSSGNVFIYTRDTIFFDKEKRVLTSGCLASSINLSSLNYIGLSKLSDGMKIKGREILSKMNDFNKHSEVFIKTGGVHSAALAIEGEDLIFYEDVGRHNAIDKIVGNAVMNKKDLNKAIILTSGRISSEIAIKASKLKIPVLCSHSAATDLAIEIAIKVNLTLIGFARFNRMNIYSGENRIIF